MNARLPLEQGSSRRQFLSQTAACAAAGWASTHLGFAAAADVATAANAPSQAKLQLYKAVKWGMIDGAPTVLDHFKICKELGYDGMELISPADFSAEEVRKASFAAGAKSEVDKKQ